MLDALTFNCGASANCGINAEGVFSDKGILKKEKVLKDLTSIMSQSTPTVVGYQELSECLWQDEVAGLALNTDTSCYRALRRAVACVPSCRVT